MSAIPPISENPETTPHPAPPVQPVPPPRPRILLADDDASIRESLGKLLRNAGYQVTFAADGQEAVEKFDAGQTNLVVLDLQMPNKSGWDAFERVTAANPLVPVIIITDRSSQYKLARAAGVGALLEKPLDIPFLLQTIRDLLTESPEARLRRIASQEGTFRFSSPDPERFSEMLRLAYTTPFRCSSGPVSRWGPNEEKAD